MLLTVVLTDVVLFVGPPACVESSLSAVCTNTCAPVVPVAFNVWWRKL